MGDLFAQVTTPEGELVSSQLKSMQPHKGQSSSYLENWTYHIFLDDGTYLIYAFNVTDFGSFKDRVSGAKFQVSFSNGPSYVARKEYNLSTFTYDSSLNMIELNPDREYRALGNFEGMHKLIFDGNKSGNKYLAELKLNVASRPYIWGNGIFSMSSSQVGLSFPIPHASVTGRVAVNDDTLSQVRGIAFMDHLHVNNKITELFTAGYRIKIGNTRNGIILNAMSSKDGEQPIGYGLEYIEGKAHLRVPQRIEILETGQVRGIAFGRKVRFHFKDRDPLTVTAYRKIHDYSILDELGGLQKFFAKKYLGGEVIEFNGVGSSSDYEENVIYNYFVIRR
jgi:hypothetical protein